VGFRRVGLCLGPSESVLEEGDEDGATGCNRASAIDYAAFEAFLFAVVL